METEATLWDLERKQTPQSATVNPHGVLSSVLGRALAASFMLWSGYKVEHQQESENSITGEAAPGIGPS